ncbi:MAG: endolytic transglycosylase MltG [Chitinophagaceae bacterium]|nr:MAG: endolytic transglycosylase MltG [Chitinophagaceae bacterium]
MLRKILLGLLVLVFISALFIGWRFFMSATDFDEKSKFLYIRTGQANETAVLKSLDSLIANPGSFSLLANRTGVWENLGPGKYEIRKGTSLWALARTLRNRRQTPVNLVITKIRTKENFAGLVGRKFESDSLAIINYMNNQDTLKHYGLDSNTIMTAVFPNTYTYFWNSTPTLIFRKLFAEYKTVWNDDRKQKASKLGLTPTESYILASIVEEETNAKEEKGTMASVYRNRLKKSIRLGADPTVKFALRDFSLKRIYEKHLAVVSPYNTYRNFGLPPGPICTPSLETLDEVLNSPETEYLYFVAKPDLSGRHLFATNYNDHLKFAKMYRKTLDSLQRIRQASKEDL